jgi:hypothetical protein
VTIAFAAAPVAGGIFADRVLFKERFAPPGGKEFVGQFPCAARRPLAAMRTPKSPRRPTDGKAARARGTQFFMEMEPGGGLFQTRDGIVTT